MRKAERRRNDTMRRASSHGAYRRFRITIHSVVSSAMVLATIGGLVRKFYVFAGGGL